MNRIARYLTISIVLLNGCSLFAQTKPDGSAPQFLFPEFIKGEVRLKNGKSQFAQLNYNTISEKIVFTQNDKIFDLVNIENVDTVYILRSKFVPYSTFCYEILLNEKIPLYVEHKGKLLSPGRPGPYGTTSQVSSSTYMTSTQLQSGYYNFKLPEDYDVKVEPVFWTKIDTALYSFSSAKQLLKIFPESQEMLKRFIRQDRITFDNIQDVIRLMTWYNKNSGK